MNKYLLLIFSLFFLSDLAHAQKGFHSYLGAEYSFTSFNMNKRNYPYYESAFISDGKGIILNTEYSFNKHFNAGINIESLFYNGQYKVYGNYPGVYYTPLHNSRYIFFEIGSGVSVSYDFHINHFNTCKFSSGVGLHRIVFASQKTKLIDSDSSFKSKPDLRQWEKAHYAFFFVAMESPVC